MDNLMFWIVDINSMPTGYGPKKTALKIVLMDIVFPKTSGYFLSVL